MPPQASSPPEYEEWSRRKEPRTGSPQYLHWTRFDNVIMEKLHKSLHAVAIPVDLHVL